MRTALKLGVLITVGMLTISQASANLIVNGGFEAGNNGFSSEYIYTTDPDGLASGGGSSGFGEGKYAIGNNPQFYHSAFTTAGPHSGNAMMIVNGWSSESDKKVWSQTSIPLTLGQSYSFSVWVMNVYPESPAELKFSISGVDLGSYTIPAGVGTWYEFQKTFTATADQNGAAVDLNVAFSGNDFAMDDICVAAVPEPGTVIAGALLLLPFGASAARILRRKP